MTLPTIAPPAAPERRRGMKRLLLGALFVLSALGSYIIGDDSGTMLILGAVLVAWGYWLRFARPERRAADASAVRATREAELNHPDRLARLARWRDGSALAGLGDADTVLETACTWYVDGAKGLRERDGGTFAVERKALRLSGATRTQTLRFSSVVKVTANANALVIERTNGPHIIVAVEDPEEVALAIAAVQR